MINKVDELNDRSLTIVHWDPAKLLQDMWFTFGLLRWLNASCNNVFSVMSVM